MFISEEVIDEVVAMLEDADFEQEVEFFGKKQGALLGYIFSEDFELLTSKERDFTLYLLIVIWKSAQNRLGSIPTISKKAIEEAEERNWELIDEVEEKHFRERITVFFDDSTQEDLLAFVEDALVEDDEDSVVTKEGREPMFVALKTMIDCIAGR